jgi:hypothetical protein
MSEKSSYNSEYDVSVARNLVDQNGRSFLNTLNAKIDQSNCDLVILDGPMHVGKSTIMRGLETIWQAEGTPRPVAFSHYDDNYRIITARNWETLDVPLAGLKQFRMFGHALYRKVYDDVKKLQETHQDGFLVADVVHEPTIEEFDSALRYLTRSRLGFLVIPVFTHPDIEGDLINRADHTVSDLPWKELAKRSQAIRLGKISRWKLQEDMELTEPIIPENFSNLVGEERNNFLDKISLRLYELLEDYRINPNNILLAFNNKLERKLAA